jgi:peptidyl-prolyl cis-trans isomerase C
MAGTTLLVSVIAMIGCGAAVSADSTVATVNGATISSEVYEAFLRSAQRPGQPELTGEQKAQLLDQLINLELAARAAEKDGLDKQANTRAQLELVRLNVLADAEFARYLQAHPVSESQIKTEYDAQIAALPKEYKAKHILVETEDQARAVIDKLGKDQSFTDLAKSESKDQSASNGGDLGWFTLQSMVKPFSDAVANLDKGTYTKSPVKTQFGWHVIQLDDMREAEPPPLDQVRDQIQGIVQRKQIQQHMTQMRDEALIQKSN